MNKAMKGAIAAGAAGILLLGGAGTFATWSDSMDIDAGAVSTGELTLSVPTGTWADVTSGSAVSIPTIGDFDIVPGDTITYTTNVTVTAEGNNLSGALAIDDAALKATKVGTDPAVVLDYINVSMSHDAATKSGLSVDETSDVITFTEASTYTIGVVVTVEFEDVDGLTGQNLNVDLAGLALSLEQV